MIANDQRLLRVKRRLLFQVMLGFLCNVLFLAVLYHLLGRIFIADWVRIVAALAILKLAPLLIVEWLNWRGAKRAISEMWAFGKLNFEDVSRELAARTAV